PSHPHIIYYACNNSVGKTAGFYYTGNKLCGGKRLSKLILGVDAGNYRAKVAGPYGVDSYRTAICDWFERDIVESFADDDMEFHIGDRKGFAGTIAAYEDIYGTGSMFGD